MLAVSRRWRFVLRCLARRDYERLRRVFLSFPRCGGRPPGKERTHVEVRHRFSGAGRAGRGRGEEGAALMPAYPLRWPRVQPLVALLQSPAHRVVRVLHVTQTNWQLPEPSRHGRGEPPRARPGTRP